MELDRLFGLPAHPLLVHIPVVLIPMAAIIAIVFAFRPVWLDRFGWGLVALTFIGAAGAVLAAGSGETLWENQRNNSRAADHADMGEAARNLSLLFFLIVAAVVTLRFFARRKNAESGIWHFIRSKGGAIAVAVVLVLSASGAMYSVSAAGHSGAKLKWGGSEQPGAPAGGDNDGG